MSSPQTIWRNPELSGTDTPTRSVPLQAFSWIQDNRRSGICPTDGADANRPVETIAD